MKVERTSDPGRHSVYGDHEADYGRQHYGWVVKEGGRYLAAGSDPREASGRQDLGDHPTLARAAAAVAAWAATALTPEALDLEFEGRTAGGRGIRFIRRTAAGIVASVEDHRRGTRMMTSWDEDGACELYADESKGTERHALGESLRLVRREPAPEAEPSAPAP